MKSGKETQRDSNPYPYSDSNKRYQTYDFYMRRRFGGKVIRVPLDAGFTCPNIDGSKGRGGCVYCAGGAGETGNNREGCVPFIRQYEEACRRREAKWGTPALTLPYLQAHTNTYADTETLRRVFSEALLLPGAVGLSVATRADCITPGCAGLLAGLSRRTFLTVELGLQSASDITAERINRCHSYEDFLRGYSLLQSCGGDINIGVHLIFGLPGETRQMMLESVKKVALLKPQLVKLHLLCVLKNTALADAYACGAYTPLTKEEYTETVCDAIELLPHDTVLGRVTGDAERGQLVAPLWSRNKRDVQNRIDEELYRRNSFQGCKYGK